MSEENIKTQSTTDNILIQEQFIIMFKEEKNFKESV